MNIRSYLYKRVLVAVRSSAFSSNGTVEELKILEVSPSGKWTKVQNMDGRKYWKNSADVVPIELLEESEPYPQKS